MSRPASRRRCEAETTGEAAHDGFLHHPDVPLHIINQNIRDPSTLAKLRATCTLLLRAVLHTQPGKVWDLIRARRWKYPDDVCLQAAIGGHLDVLQWARRNGCPWDKRTCSRAAFGGHLPVLQWARENDCPWDVSTCYFAARGGHREVLQWARANGFPEPYESYSPASHYDF